MKKAIRDKQFIVEPTWTHWLLQAVGQLGLKDEGFLREFVELVDDTPSLSLDIGRVRSVYHRIDKMANDPLLGVKLSQLSDQRALGIISPLCWHSPTLRDTIHNLIRFLCIVSGNGEFVLTTPLETPENRDDIQITYRPRAYTIPPNRHQSLLVTSKVVSNIRAMTRQQDSIVRMGIPAVLNAEAVGKALSCETYIHKVQTEITLQLRGDLLDKPIEGRDEELYSVVLNHAISREKEINRYQGLADDIGAFIRNNGFNTADIVQFCSQQGLHKRELQRTLAAQGLSFRQIRQKETRDMALSLLMHSDKSISDIAAQLGYAEPASFARACASWFERSPSDVRKSGWIPTGNRS